MHTFTAELQIEVDAKMAAPLCSSVAFHRICVTMQMIFHALNNERKGELRFNQTKVNSGCRENRGGFSYRISGFNL